MCYDSTINIHRLKRITDDILPNWDSNSLMSEYNGITVVKDIRIKEGYKVYINTDYSKHYKYMGVYTFIEDLLKLAKDIGVDYDIK